MSNKNSTTDIRLSLPIVNCHLHFSISTMDNTIKPVDQFYLNKKEPVKSCLQALRSIILSYSNDITEHWKYGLPFFYFKNKPFAYLWIDKKTLHPYIGVVKGIFIDHPSLDQGNRKKMKVMNIDPNADIPVEVIYEVLGEAVLFYEKR